MIDNALKHTPVGGDVTIDLACVGKYASISVRDEGPGIAPAMLPRIFERFYRGDSARTAGGAGLGLAIARALVEAQGGSIAVESGAGTGSVFTIQLRCAGE